MKEKCEKNTAVNSGVRRKFPLEKETPTLCCVASKKEKFDVEKLYLHCLDRFEQSWRNAELQEIKVVSNVKEKRHL